MDSITFADFTRVAAYFGVNELTLLGSCIGFAFEIALCVSILRSKVPQNFATWILWAIIDGIVAASLIYQCGNFLLSATYSAGSLAVALIILKSTRISWTRKESFCAGTALASMIVWGMLGPWGATIASTIASTFAGYPLVADCHERPWDYPLSLYAGFLVAGAIATAGGKSWSVEERLYPAVCTILCVFVVVFIARKFWLVRPVEIVS